MSAFPPKADMCDALADVCFGPKADICAAIRHVRFTPESGHPFVDFNEHSSARDGSTFKPRVYRATAASTVASL
jgi:hypothetical protein